MILEDAEIGQVYNILIGKKTSSKTLKKMILVKQDKNKDYFFLDYKSYNKNFMYCSGTKISFEKIFNKYSDEFVKEYLHEKEKKENQKRIFRETYFKG